MVSCSLILSSSVTVLVDSFASLVSLVLLSVSLSVFSDLFSLSSSSSFSLTLSPSSSCANLLLSCGLVVLLVEISSLALTNSSLNFLASV